MSNNEKERCSICEFFEQFSKSLTEGHCIYYELNCGRVVRKNINDKCRKFKYKGTLPKDIVAEYKKRHLELKNEWRIARLRKQLIPLEEQLDKFYDEDDLFSDRIDQLEKKIERIESEIRKIDGEINS